MSFRDMQDGGVVLEGVRCAVDKMQSGDLEVAVQTVHEWMRSQGVRYTQAEVQNALADLFPGRFRHVRVSVVGEESR